MPIVVFDFDGTLVDTAPVFARAAADADLAAVRRIVSNASRYTEIFRELSTDVDSGEAPDPETSRPEGIGRRFREIYPREGKLYPGVYRMLMALEGSHGVGVAGSAPNDLLVEMIDYFGLDGYVDHVVSVNDGDGSGTEGSRRPVEAIDRDPDEMIWVSGRRSSLEIARKLDIATVLASYGYAAEAEVTADDRIDRLSGLLTLLPGV